MTLSDDQTFGETISFDKAWQDFCDALKVLNGDQATVALKRIRFDSKEGRGTLLLHTMLPYLDPVWGTGTIDEDRMDFLDKVLPVCMEQGWSPLSLRQREFDDLFQHKSDLVPCVAKWCAFYNLTDEYLNTFTHLLAYRLSAKPYYFVHGLKDMTKINRFGQTVMHGMASDIVGYETRWLPDLIESLLLAERHGGDWYAQDERGQTPFGLIEKAIPSLTDKEGQKILRSFLNETKARVEKNEIFQGLSDTRQKTAAAKKKM